MDAEQVVPVQNKTMIEKWLLVLLIVGGTSLVFLICFPIDFYLYRRRKRLARERSSAVDKKPIPVYRTGQYHAQVYPDSVECTTEIEEGLKGELRENDIKPSRFVRIVNLFRKKKTESRLMHLQKLTEKSDTSSSDNPTVYITSENREETSIFRSHDTQITIPGSADTPNLLTSESSQQDEITASYQGLNQSEFSVHHENPTNENIPYMAKALSVIMSENEELFTPENKHLNYGSTEKISTVHVTREMLESINNSLFGDDTAQSTSHGNHGLLGTDKHNQTGAVFFPDTGESSTDHADKQSDETKSRDKNVINVKSNKNAGTKHTKPPKGNSKRSKSSSVSKLSDTSEQDNQMDDIRPSSLPDGIMTYNIGLSDSDETGSDASDDQVNDNHDTSDVFSNNDENRSIGDDRNPMSFYKTMTSSFSDQYLSKDRKPGAILNAIPPTDIDEFSDMRPSIDLTNSNFSLLEDAASASRRKKKKKKADDRLSPNSLPNLSANKSRIKSKQDYYKERRTVSATSSKFSKY